MGEGIIDSQEKVGHVDNGQIMSPGGDQHTSITLRKGVKRWRERGREGWREEGRKGEREGGREREREGERGREREREGERGG